MTKNIDKTILKKFLIEIFKDDKTFFEEIAEELKNITHEEGTKENSTIAEEELDALITKNFARYGEVYKALA
ncbi:MAG: hypothetical protein JNL70_03965 [Saprospiraceae bacterium]|nr:hypothetical protein [Saprospiraceae bacterium]